MTVRAGAVAACLSLVLAGCSAGSDDVIDYAVDGTLTSYNTNTVSGAASGGPQAFARVLTGFTYRGPDGQTVSDRDYGTVAVVGRAPLILDYEINANAVYSDGKPITCDDMVLTWAAQSGRFPAFDAASTAGYRDIAGVDCVPGQKKARVTFAQDRGIVDYGQLFGATAMLPSHVLADELGLGEGGVTRAIQTPDLPALDRIAAAWNTSWNLGPDVDVKKLPSSGPYKVDSVNGDGAVVLVANDKWWGAKPVTPRVTVWARGADIQDRINNGSFDIVDISAGSSGTLNLPAGFTRTDTASAGIEQLIFSAQGVMAAPPNRRALSLCTPRETIARNAQVPIANARLSPTTEDALSAAESAGAANQFVVPDIGGARLALNNQPLTVRIGYQSPNPRLAATVGSIAQACAPAGITVTDAAGDAVGPQSLRDNTVDVLIASTGGAVGSGSTGSSALDAYDLHTGNGNNLSGYSNERIDGIIDALVVTADPKELARLLGESGPILWADVPTLPLYRQQRTLLTAKAVGAVSSNPTRWGAGWNMDRWTLS
ncbi:ABC transporter substrate-binding protein [Mycolicibacterium bacteremicum]|uniref:ABC transporter substrate-binding protein n=1 Tax=Mycolicibacterium bacteremicum TaxID=564198 RepID=UPI0026E9D98A|nr:ABC transporter substrate-binding protein [Mycolicibacterium bacteremicum]